MSAPHSVIEGVAGRAPLRLAASRLGSVLIVGAGSIGTRHLVNLRALGARHLVLHRSGQGRREIALPDVAIETNLAAALAHRPAAVFVCNPTVFHLKTALEAVRAGCDVFIEKPVSDSLDGVDELAAEITRQGRRVMVGFQFRFHPALGQVREWIAAGEIGELVSLRAHWGEYLPGWHPDEDYRDSYSARRELGGGVILTLCHPFDYLRWIAGEVVEVQAITTQGTGLELNVEDTAHVLLRFASGALGAVTLNYAEQPPSHELHIVGRHGTIRWSDADGVAHLHATPSGRRLVARPPDGFSRNLMFVEEARHFLECVAGEKEPACGFRDGVAALRIALAAKASASMGRAVDV